MKDELAFCMESRKITLDMLKPGTPCKDIWDGFNAFMRKNGRPEERGSIATARATIWSSGRWCATTSRWTIEKDMNIVVHPTYIHGGLPQLAVRQLPDRRQRTGRPAAQVSRRGRRGRLRRLSLTRCPRA